MMVPRKLLDQLPQEPFTADEFIANYMTHPTNFLYAVVDRSDEDEPRKGFFWMQVNPLEKVIRILLLSLDKEFSRKHPGFLFRYLKPWFIAAAKLMKFRIVWGRLRPIKEGKTHDGYLRELRTFVLEV